MTRTSVVAAAVVLAWAWTASARGPRTGTSQAEPTRPAYVPSPMAVGRVRVEVRGAKVLITTDVTIPAPRGVLSDMDVHVAYGAPGTPSAFDAQLVGTPAGYLVAPIESSGTMLAHGWAPHAPAEAAVLVGRPRMGGQTVRVTAAALAAAQKQTGRATLRIRQVYALPPLLSDASREIVVRLASAEGKALALGLVEFASDTPTARVEARYCGLQGESAELFVAGARGGRGRRAPPLAERGEHDDLCVRFGASVERPPSER